MNLYRSVAPALEPVSISEAKAFLRITDSDQDTEVSGLISSAREYVEAALNRSLMTQTWVLRLRCFEEPIVLPNPPLISVSSITYLDIDGTSQTLSSSVYTVDTYREPSGIVLAYAQSWPSTRDQINAVTITYTAGYGGSSDTVPASIKHAIKILISHWYENREPVITGSIIQEVPLSVDAILTPFKVWSM